MTHLQTANNYPDMAAIGFIQQFALLNQITLTGAGGPGSPLYRQQLPAQCIVCVRVRAQRSCYAIASPARAARGWISTTRAGNNDALVTRIINANVPGFYVFSAPWETISALMANINKLKGIT